MKNGQFRENLGIKVHEERHAREKARRKRAERSVEKPNPGAQELRDRIAAAEGPLAEMRKSLGIPNSLTQDDGTDKSS